MKMSERELKCGEFLCQCPPYDCLENGFMIKKDKNPLIKSPIKANPTKAKEYITKMKQKDISDDFLDEQSDENKLNEFIKMLDEQSETAIYAGVTLTYEQFHYLIEKLAKEIEFRKYIKQTLRNDENDK